jgi:hypothetical protein
VRVGMEATGCPGQVLLIPSVRGYRPLRLPAAVEHKRDAAHSTGSRAAQGKPKIEKIVRASTNAEVPRWLLLAASPPPATVPNFVPHLSRKLSQMVVEKRVRESPVLARKINTLANRRTPSQMTR